MEVTCERCDTRYEFEDALVSERGTTVKCSSCGHQFRVQQSQDSGVTHWVVRRPDGEELVYDAMRELQSAIIGGEIEPDDVLAPKGKPERRLGDIAELESFFDRSTRHELSTQPGMGSGGKTGGVALPARSGKTLRPPSEHSPEPPRGAKGRGRGRYTSTPPPPLPDSVPPPPVGDDDPTPMHQPDDERLSRDPTPLAGTPVGVKALSELGTDKIARRSSKPLKREFEDSEPTAVAFDDEEPTRLRSSDDDDADIPSSHDDFGDSEAPAPSGALPAVVSVVDDLDDVDDLGDVDDLDEETLDAAETLYTVEDPEISSIPVLTPSPSVVRPSLLRRSYTGPRFTTVAPTTHRPGFGRWVVSIIVLGSLIVAGFIWLKRQPGSATPDNANKPVIASDPRIDTLLTEANKRLLNGDLDGAQEHYVKASAITSDPRIAIGLAQVAVIRADETWLHLRLLPKKANAARDLLSSQLSQRLSKVDAAMKGLGPQSTPDSARKSAQIVLRIDQFRLRGDAANARQHTATLKNEGADAGRCLASLDLAAERFDPQSVTARLREAARSEQNMGRAQALLVYALARIGDKEAAKRELAAFKSSHPKHALLRALTKYVDSAREAPPDDDPLAAVTPAGSADPLAVPTDFREALRQASQARAQGNIGRAETLYRAALEENPGNSEALTGLAQIAHSRGDSAAAASRYRSLLKQNPGYLPALMALADIQWARGARGEALALYRRVVQNSGSSAHGRRAQARLDEASKEKPSTAPTTTNTDPATPPAAPPNSATPPDTRDLPPATDEPEPPPPAATSKPAGDVDLSDLPEFQ